MGTVLVGMARLWLCWWPPEEDISSPLCCPGPGRRRRLRRRERAAAAAALDFLPLSGWRGRLSVSGALSSPSTASTATFSLGLRQQQETRGPGGEAGQPAEEGGAQPGGGSGPARSPGGGGGCSAPGPRRSTLGPSAPWAPGLRRAAVTFLAASLVLRWRVKSDRGTESCKSGTKERTWEGAAFSYLCMDSGAKQNPPLLLDC